MLCLLRAASVSAVGTGASRSALGSGGDRGAPSASDGSTTLQIDDLIGFSEFSVALAGFAAIALVLGRREGTISPGSAYVVRFMVINALGPALLALLAVVLYTLGLSEPTSLRLSSAAYLSIGAFFTLLSIWEERQLSSAGALVLPAALGRAIWAGAVLSYMVHLVNLVGFPFEPSLGLFLLGLWILLLMASVQFVALLFLALR